MFSRASAWLTDRMGHTWAWRYGRPMLRVTRVAMATGSVFGLGYSTGMRDCLEDRNGSVSAMMSAVLARTSHRGSVLHPSDPTALRVARVGQEVIAAAQQHLQACVAAAADDLERSVIRERLVRLSRHRWNFVVVDDAMPNAFITEGLPGFVFCHRGMLNNLDNDDELSFILAHEVAHYLCQVRAIQHYLIPLAMLFCYRVEVEAALHIYAHSDGRIVVLLLLLNLEWVARVVSCRVKSGEG